ncbi:hypothetical protein [Flavobacterium sp. HNIBRBA15423]|uniref:hypothetical protein n=1 Tax=Flavobacterium sp. HNIBRBA15423 TaxID=3458683 RepID=UPI00404440E0
MKKTIMISFITFFSISILNSQSLEAVKKADTLYIYFDKEHKNTVKYHDANKHIDFYKNYVTYGFNPHPSSIILFNSNTYKDYDNMRKGIKNDERIEKKSFLKKNKDIILDYDFFAENGFKKTFFALYKKTIYLIDEDEIKGRKIKVKQVDISCATCFEE